MDGQSDRDSIMLLRLLMILYRGEEEGCTIYSYIEEIISNKRNPEICYKSRLMDKK